MKKSLLVAAACVLSLSFAFSSSCIGAEKVSKTNIAVVDVERLLEQSELGKKATARDKQVQTIFQKGMDDVVKKVEDAPKDKRQQSLVQAQQFFQQKLNQETMASRSVVLKTILDSVKEWRVKNKGHVVVSRQSLLDSDSSLDITDEILVAMNTKKVELPSLPSVQFKEEKKDGKKDEKKAEKKGEKK